MEMTTVMHNSQTANIHNGAGLGPGQSGGVNFRWNNFLEPLGYSPAHSGADWYLLVLFNALPRFCVRDDDIPATRGLSP